MEPPAQKQSVIVKLLELRPIFGPAEQARTATA